MKQSVPPPAATAPVQHGDLDGGSRLARIARRAHELFQARGGAPGLNLDDWLRAEREIDATGSLR